MKLANICIITEDVNRLAAFYQEVLQLEPQMYSCDYAVFQMSEGSVLSLYKLSSHAKTVAPGAAQGASNKSISLEFQILDADKEYARLKAMNIDMLTPPLTQPWGSRSFYFRDLDDNLIHFSSR